MLLEELLEFAKSSRFMQSLQIDLGRPVPCEQGAADLSVTASSADLIFRFYVLVCLCLCVCVFGVVGLWDCGAVSFWVCVLVSYWFCRFAGVWVCVCVC